MCNTNDIGDQESKNSDTNKLIKIVRIDFNLTHMFINKLKSEIELYSQQLMN